MHAVNIYSKKQRWKFLLLIVSVAIGAASLLYTNKLVKDLSVEEHKRIGLWAEATQRVFEATTDQQDLNFLLQVIETNTTIPAILTDENYSIIAYRNIDSIKALKPGYVQKILADMKNQKPPIELIMEGNNKNFCFYSDSVILRRLTFYPYVQLFIIIIFVLVSYFAFSSSRKAEQNKVWVGLSRETAHQLGTPTSSLMAWVELLKEKDENSAIVSELEKDVKRLEVITERFSNIGSQPKLKMTDVNVVINGVVEYMRNRIPGSVKLTFTFPDKDLSVPLNINLFAWVIENIIKNALDATGNNGSVHINVFEDKKGILVDIKDNGKGISRANISRVFKPGFTTKSRGWGLGLSLARRIIEEYHKGKIFVLSSDANRGTTFRIILPFPK